VAADPSGQPEIQFQDRSYGLLTLFPQPPIFGWLARFDAEVAESATFQEARFVVLDLSSAPLHAPGIRALVTELEARRIRVVGLTGLTSDQIGEHANQMPPILPDAHLSQLAGATKAAPASLASPPREPAREPPSLLIEENIRSGQQIRFPGGDVTLVGSLSSGAEIVAGGSIHVYGTLRGRAIAGVAGDRAQIFCHRLEAELLSINGVSMVADEMDPHLTGRAVRAWKDQDVIRLRKLD
jgi:septum site-determining protein MinC